MDLQCILDIFRILEKLIIFTRVMVLVVLDAGSDNILRHTKGIGPILVQTHTWVVLGIRAGVTGIVGSKLALGPNNTQDSTVLSIFLKDLALLVYYVAYLH